MCNVGAQFIAPFYLGVIYHAVLYPGAMKQGAMNCAPTIGNIIRAFKARSTVRINRQQGGNGMPIWQRNYYEHIVRGEVSLDKIRKYIKNNPAEWAFDKENPNLPTHS